MADQSIYSEGGDFEEENKGNESVDWEMQDELQEAENNEFRKNLENVGDIPVISVRNSQWRCDLTPVTEESRIGSQEFKTRGPSSPSRRPIQVNPHQETIFTTPRNGSTFGEGLRLSPFNGQNQNLFDSAEFCGDASKNFRLMEQEQKALDSSGRRLDLPPNFDPNTYNFSNQESSWDKGPHIWNIQNPDPIGRSPSESETRPSSQPPREPEIPTTSQPPVIKTEPISPLKVASFDAQTTPSRPRHLTSRLSGHTTLQSTPKREGSEPPEFQVSAIGNPGDNFFNSQLSLFPDETSNIVANNVITEMKQLPPNATPHEVMAVLERIRLDKLNKQKQREKERSIFISSFGQRKGISKDQIVTKSTQQSLEERRKPLKSVENFEEKKQNKSVSFDSNVKTSYFQQNSSRNIQEEFLPPCQPQSETLSRASSSASVCRPGTQMSSASNKINLLRIQGVSEKFLIFGCVALNNRFVKELQLTNISETTISIEAQLTKDKGYQILDGNCMQLSPKESTTLRIQFQPSEEYRYNSMLKIKTNFITEYAIYLRGIGGKAAVRLEKTSAIERSSTGPYLMSAQSYTQTHQIRVVNDGIIAYCKALVFYGGQPVEATIEPSSCVVLKTKQAADFNITISLQVMRMDARRESMQSLRSISSQCSVYDGLEIVLLWGEEIYRQRSFEFLKKAKEQFANNHAFSLKDEFKGQRIFREKSDYLPNRSDISVFEGSVQRHVIRIMPQNQHQSLDETTLRPDDTMARVQRDWDEKTLVNDYNETTIRN